MAGGGPKLVNAPAAGVAAALPVHEMTGAKIIEAPRNAPLSSAPVTPARITAVNRWQDNHAAAGWQDKLTRLNPSEEKTFQQWATANKAQATPDYDMRGFWQAYAGGDPRAQTTVDPNDHKQHFSDLWKTPLHETFSGESLYADPATNPPMWNDLDQLVAHDGTIIHDERARRR